MKITTLLADAAQVVEGKLYLLGGGWTVTGPTPAPSAVTILFEFDPTEAGGNINWNLSLLNQDGQGVIVGDPERHDAHQHMSFDGNMVVPPGGAVSGAPISVPFVLNLAPLPLPPGESFVWRLTVNGETRPDWELPFAVRAAVPPTGMGFPLGDPSDPASLPHFE